MRSLSCPLAVAAAIVVVAAPARYVDAQTAPTETRLTPTPAKPAPLKPFTGGPVTIADQGSFFIGGVTKISEHASIPGAPPGQTPPAPTAQQITIGQMYVQFQIPAKIKGPGWPVIMVHGSTHTGAALEATPDEREGWYPYFVRKGVATYVVDQAGRGRSGFDHSVLHEARAKALAGDAAGAAALLPNFGRISDTQAWTFWFGHMLPAGSTIATGGRLITHGDPGDPQPPNPAKAHVAPLFPTAAAGEYYATRSPTWWWKATTPASASSARRTSTRSRSAGPPGRERPRPTTSSWTTGRCSAPRT
jgi:hypothetical protein